MQCKHSFHRSYQQKDMGWIEQRLSPNLMADHVVLRRTCRFVASPYFWDQPMRLKPSFFQWNESKVWFCWLNTGIAGGWPWTAWAQAHFWVSEQLRKTSADGIWFDHRVRAPEHVAVQHQDVGRSLIKPLQLWPFTTYNWWFLWDYTFYKWSFVSTYNW